MANIRENIKSGKVVSYRFTVCLERDANNKQIRRYTTWTPPTGLTPAKMKKAALSAADAWEQQVRTEYQNEKELGQAYTLPPEKRRDNFKTFVNDVWFPLQVCNGNDKQTTVTFYKNMKKQIVEYFDGKVLQEISPLHIQRFLSYMSNEYKTERDKPLAPKTVRHYYNVLGMLFAYAEKQGMIAANPMLKVDAPKKDKKPVDALTQEQAQQFFRALADSPLDFHCMLHLLLTSGIRRGECLGLKWKDLDEQRATLTIERSAVYTPETGTTISTPKTADSIRTIPIMPATLPRNAVLFPVTATFATVFICFIQFSKNVIIIIERTRRTERNGETDFPSDFLLYYSNKRKTKIRWMKEKTKCSSWNYAHTIEPSWKNRSALPAQTASREAWSGRDIPLRVVGGDRDTPSP